MSQKDAPSTFQGVTISGTFEDVVEHRNILRKALERSELYPVDMQNYVPAAKDDVISSSLEMVQKGSAYIGLISHRYGQIPDDERNPEKYSITRMEFEKAQELGRPTLIFVMGDDHYVKRAHVEQDADKIQKLEEFRKRAKDKRVYVTFNNLADFEREVLLTIPKLKRDIEENAAVELARPHAFFAEPAPLETVATTEFDPKFPCFNVPFRSKGEGVVGRDGILEKIREEFQREVGTPFGKLVSLVGLGGLGKTQLAVEYAYSHRGEYSGGVIWLGADEDIDSQLTSLSEEAKWVSPVSDHKTKLDVALNRIRSRSDCLIVFDNLEDFDRIRPYLPRTEATPHLLLTSQREVPGIPSIGLDFLDPADSRALLVREAGGSPSTENETAVAEILERLDGLPLALEMAGAFVKRLNLDWRTYLGQLKERPRRTLKGTPLGSFTNHDPDVFATLRVSERVLDDDTLLRAAIDVLTWSGSADMGIGLLASLVECSEGDLIPSLMTAVNVRLIRKHPRQNRYSLHRLLQLARRENAETPDFEVWSDRIAQRLGDWFEQRRQNFSDLAAFEAEFDHLVAWQTRSASISNELNAKLIWLQAYPPYHRGRNQQSHELVSEAASIMERTSVGNSALKASILSDFGYTKHLLGDYYKALELEQEALGIRLAIFGEDHVDTAMSYGNLGGTYHSLDRDAEALKLHQKTLDIRLRIRGESHPDTARSYGNLGSTHRSLGKYEKARGLEQKALDIRRATLGEDHPDTATSYGNLGTTYGALRKYEDALALNQKALDIRRATLGEDHPDTATAYGNLGTSFAHLGKHDKALELEQRAFGIRIATLGEDHPDTAISYGNLGACYYRSGKYGAALEMAQKAHRVRKATLGVLHELTRRSSINLAMCLGNLNRLEEAKVALAEAVNSLPVTHPVYKRAQKISRELKDKKNQRGSRFTPPKKRRKKRRQ